MLTSATASKNCGFSTAPLSQTHLAMAHMQTGYTTGLRQATLHMELAT